MLLCRVLIENASVWQGRNQCVSPMYSYLNFVAFLGLIRT
jgi:hypothetical protein